MCSFDFKLAPVYTILALLFAIACAMLWIWAPWYIGIAGSILFGLPTLTLLFWTIDER